MPPLVPCVVLVANGAAHVRSGHEILAAGARPLGHRMVRVADWAHAVHGLLCLFVNALRGTSEKRIERALLVVEQHVDGGVEQLCSFEAHLDNMTVEMCASGLLRASLDVVTREKKPKEIHDAPGERG